MRLFKDEIKNVYTGSQAKKFRKPTEAVAHPLGGNHADMNGGHGGGGGDAHGDGTWIYSFADLIMNLLMFFVMMFAISSIDKDKFSKVQEAFSSFSKDADKKSNSGGMANVAPTVGTAGQIQQLSNVEILERLQVLLDMVDKKKVDRSKQDTAKFDAIAARVSKLATETKLEFATDPLGNAFEIVIGSQNIFTKNTTQISKNGQKLLSEISSELLQYKIDFNIQIRSYLKPSIQMNSQNAYSKSSEQAAVILGFLEASPVKDRVVDWSLAGFGFDKSSPDNMLMDKIVIRVAARPKTQAYETGEQAK